MKKNVMMRIASVLLVAVLVSTSAISGTYAKYVTSASGSDTARVAKWGVEVTAQGSSMFSNEYDTHDKTYTGDVSVKSDDDANVVAPGTSSEDAPAVFTISGKPEVATRITVEVTGVQDVYLKAGTYTDYTEHLYDEDNDKWYYNTFTLDADYYPVVWTLSLTEDASENLTDADEPQVIKRGTLDEVKAALETYVNTASYAPNEDLGATFELSWSWAFDSDNNPNNQPTNDKADTLLGNLASGLETSVATDDYCTDISYEVKITVTQID